jgi:hypothetical protein
MEQCSFFFLFGMMECGVCGNPLPYAWSWRSMSIVEIVFEVLEKGRDWDDVNEICAMGQTSEWKPQRVLLRLFQV